MSIIGIARVLGITSVDRDTTHEIRRGEPRWCIEHVDLGDGITLHASQRAVLEVQDDGADRQVAFRATRVDRPGETGPVTVTLTVDRSTTVDLPIDAFGALLNLGSTLAADIIHQRRQRSVQDYRLSGRELEVLAGLAAGRLDVEIGRSLYLSEHTVKTHTRRLYEKLGARNRAHAVAIAARAGLLPGDLSDGQVA